MAGGEFWFGTASIYMRRTSADRAARYNPQPRYYMATDLDRVRQFFPDFRRFIVMASRKLGIDEPSPIVSNHVQHCRLLQHAAANANPSRPLKYRQYRLT